MADTLTVAAPGRICLFGEHQDFLGLPVIAAAIDLHITIFGRRVGGDVIRLDMPDIEDADEFDPCCALEPRTPRDYLRAAINVLLREGIQPPLGWDCTITGKLPINAGCSSSSALTVAWVKFLLEAADACGKDDPAAVARLAHRAEVVEFGEPGGMMDHYTSAMGGVVHIDTRDPIEVTPLRESMDGFVLGDSVERKETTTVLRRSKEDVLEGVRLLKERHGEFDLHATTLDDAGPWLADLPEHNRLKVEANIIDRDLCRRGLELLRGGLDPAAVGRLLTQHHWELSGKLGVSTPKLDRMVEAAVAAGALGAKLNGSGGGGCMFAYCPGAEERVAAALADAGGKPCIVHSDSGARVIGECGGA
ncbi:MAG: GHMP kinase [Armatimonadota bacterium]|nr:MAG: GHMP kinase [Armatimonadota bacterium]